MGNSNGPVLTAVPPPAIAAANHCHAQETDSPVRSANVALQKLGKSFMFPVEIVYQIASCGVLAPKDVARLSMISKGSFLEHACSSY